MNTDIRYSKQDAAETGHGWYAVRRDRDHKLPDVSHLFRTREEAEAWARRKGDLIRDARMRPDEPHTWSESWLFIAPMGLIALAVYVARAWGWL